MKFASADPLMVGSSSRLQQRRRQRHQQLTETIIPDGSCTAGVEPGVDIGQVPLSGRLKTPSTTGARVPLTVCGKLPGVVFWTPLIFVNEPIVAEYSVMLPTGAAGLVGELC